MTVWRGRFFICLIHSNWLQNNGVETWTRCFDRGEDDDDDGVDTMDNNDTTIDEMVASDDTVDEET